MSSPETAQGPQSPESLTPEEQAERRYRFLSPDSIADMRERQREAIMEAWAHAEEASSEPLSQEELRNVMRAAEVDALAKHVDDAGITGQEKNMLLIGLKDLSYSLMDDDRWEGRGDTDTDAGSEKSGIKLAQELQEKAKHKFIEDSRGRDDETAERVDNTGHVIVEGTVVADPTSTPAASPPPPRRPVSRPPQPASASTPPPASSPSSIPHPRPPVSRPPQTPDQSAPPAPEQQANTPETPLNPDTTGDRAYKETEFLRVGDIGKLRREQATEFRTRLQERMDAGARVTAPIRRWIRETVAEETVDAYLDRQNHLSPQERAHYRDVLLGFSINNMNSDAWGKDQTDAEGNVTLRGSEQAKLQYREERRRRQRQYANESVSATPREPAVPRPAPAPSQPTSPPRPPVSRPPAQPQQQPAPQATPTPDQSPSAPEAQAATPAASPETPEQNLRFLHPDQIASLRRRQHELVRHNPDAQSGSAQEVANALDRIIDQTIEEYLNTNAPAWSEELRYYYTESLRRLSIDNLSDAQWEGDPDQADSQGNFASGYNEAAALYEEELQSYRDRNIESDHENKGDDDEGDVQATPVAPPSSRPVSPPPLRPPSTPPPAANPVTPPATPDIDWGVPDGGDPAYRSSRGPNPYDLSPRGREALDRLRTQELSEAEADQLAAQEARDEAMVKRLKAPFWKRGQARRDYNKAAEDYADYTEGYLNALAAVYESKGYSDDRIAMELARVAQKLQNMSIEAEHDLLVEQSGWLGRAAEKYAGLSRKKKVIVGLGVTAAIAATSSPSPRCSRPARRGRPGSGRAPSSDRRAPSTPSNSPSASLSPRRRRRNRSSTPRCRGARARCGGRRIGWPCGLPESAHTIRVAAITATADPSATSTEYGFCRSRLPSSAP